MNMEAPAVLDKSPPTDLPHEITPVPPAANDSLEILRQRELDYAERLLDGDISHMHKIYMYYLHNLIKHSARKSITAYRLVAFLEAHNIVEYPADYEGKKFPSKKAVAVKVKKGAGTEAAYPLTDARKGEVTEEDWALLQEYFSKYAQPQALSEEDVTYKNLMRLGKVLGLQEVEKKTLEFLYLGARYSDLSTLMASVFDEDLAKSGVAIARMLDRPAEGRAFFTAINGNSKLARYGLTYYDMSGNGSDNTSIPEVDGFILDKLGDLDMSDDQIVAVLLGKPVKAELKIEDFSQLGEPLDLGLNLIKNAIAQGEKGINILIYGPPGTGKTKLAEAISSYLNVRLFSIGEPSNDDESDDSSIKYDENGAERSTDRVRISQLLRTQALLEGSRDSIILVDELEDLLIKGTDTSKSADAQNKLLMNRLLENNPIVTIWTGNNPEKFHESFRQRFTFSLLMDNPPTLVRERVWRRRLELNEATLPETEIRDLAREYAAPPRMLAHAVKVMRITGGGIDTIRKVLAADSRIVYGQSDHILVDEKIPQGFDLDFVSADQDVRTVFNRLVDRGNSKKPFSLLLRTDRDMGSESMLQMMAEKMVMNPMEVSAGSLVAPAPMGPSPAARIAAAFDHAADTRQFLILTDFQDMVENPKEEKVWAKDELVHFLVDQSLSHKLPFAVTIKPDAKLPPNVLLAFSDALKINPIANDNAAILYKRVFAQDVPEDKIASLKDLAALDFFKVKNLMSRLEITPENFDHDKVIGLLLRFKEARTTFPGQKMGF